MGKLACRIPPKQTFGTPLRGEILFDLIRIFISIFRMGINTIGNALPQQLKAAGFDVKQMKISGTSVRFVFVCVLFYTIEYLFSFSERPPLTVQ